MAGGARFPTPPPPRKALRLTDLFFWVFWGFFSSWIRKGVKVHPVVWSSGIDLWFQYYQ